LRLDLKSITPMQYRSRKVLAKNDATEGEVNGEN